MCIVWAQHHIIIRWSGRGPSYLYSTRTVPISTQQSLSMWPLLWHMLHMLPFGSSDELISRCHIFKLSLWIPTLDSYVDPKAWKMCLDVPWADSFRLWVCFTAGLKFLWISNSLWIGSNLVIRWRYPLSSITRIKKMQVTFSLETLSLRSSYLYFIFAPFLQKNWVALSGKIILRTLSNRWELIVATVPVWGKGNMMDSFWKYRRRFLIYYTNLHQCCLWNMRK